MWCESGQLLVSSERSQALSLVELSCIKTHNCIKFQTEGMVVPDTWESRHLSVSFGAAAYQLGDLEQSQDSLSSVINI